MPRLVTSIDSVSKRFGSETAVDELSFGVEAGQAALVLTAWAVVLVLVAALLQRERDVP